MFFNSPTGSYNYVNALQPEDEPEEQSEEQVDTPEFGSEDPSQPFDPNYVFPYTANPYTRHSDSDDDDEYEAGPEGTRLSSPTSSVTSWYSPSKRRAGLGAQRRNALLFRSIDFSNVNAPFSDAKRRRSAASGGDGGNGSGDCGDGGMPATVADSLLEENDSSGSDSSSSDSDDSSNSSFSECVPSYENDSEYRSSTLNKVNLAAASLMDQLFAVMERSMRQLWRRKLDFLLELIVPLVFMAVSIALWAIWGNEYNQEMQYLNYSNMDVTDGTIGAAGFYPPVVRDFTCIRQPPGTKPFPYFIQCGMLPRVICDGDPTFLPFPEGTKICRFTYDFISSWRALIVASLQFYWRQLTAVPTLDSLISLQWTVLTSYKDIIPLISATIGGLAANTRFSSILCSGNLYFVGPSVATRGLIDYMNSTSELFVYVANTTVYQTVEDARKASNARKKDRLWAIVELRQMDALGLDLVLHMNNSALPSFGITYDDAYSGGVLFDTAELYVLSGFATLQQLVSEYYLNTFHNADIDTTQMIVATSTPGFKRKPLLITAREVLPLIYALAFLYSVSQQTKRIVLEKELRIRESMLIMGLKQWTLYVSEFLTQLFIFVITCILCTLMLRLTYVTKSDPMIMFMNFLIFSLTTIPLSGIIAAFFSKSRLASLVSPVIYFILVIPMFAMANAHGPIITGFSIFSPSGFAAAMNIFLKHETGSGCGGKEITSSHDNPTMAAVLGMLTADFFIYYLLMLYLDAVVPKEWGTPKHPLFFILDPIRWWRGTKHKRLEGGPDGRAENGVFETTDYTNDVVSFDGLRKEYSRGGKKFVAVNNLYWGMKEGEISVLLGHNGAGKTTVLNMMTGMTEPDEGDCYVYGHSVRMEKNAVRQLLGFCPQHNILWSELTCRDHLEFYGKIKGLKGWELEDAICGMLFETDLLDKVDVSARRLSGGMKRKLSIAIAFVGMSKMVFLDEPTAGLDVGARRQVWELLKRMAQSRTILLTTHYMDEADLLGSRIGIMSQGRLKCTGSSLFLKSRLGVGYSIVVSVDPEIDAAGVDELVLGAVEGATVLGHNGCELSYQLPTASEDQFPALLNEIDSVEAVGIRGYSLAATTLEEVFLKVSEEDIEGRGADVDPSDVELIWSCEVTTSVLWAQFIAMVRKRFWNATRDRRMQCFQIVCPVLCILIAMLLSLVKYRDPQSISYTYDMFANEPPSVMYTAFCDTVWGTNPSSRGFTVSETHFKTAEMVSQMLLDTWYVHKVPRYGAVSCSDRNMSYTLGRNGAWRGNDVNVFLYNTSSHHQVPLDLATYYDLYLKHLTNSNTYNMKYSATLFHKPTSTTQLSFVFIGALIMVPFTFLPSNPVAWIVKERQCGSRHLQNLCGVNFFVYWGANFLF
ncbi:ABC1 transporter, partial [Lotmaria passim]